VFNMSNINLLFCYYCLFRGQLLYAFDALIEVDLLDSKDVVNLKLLSRTDLGLTFTKLHCWRLTQYKKCVFLDADTLVSGCTIDFVPRMSLCYTQKLDLHWIWTNPEQIYDLINRQFLCGKCHKPGKRPTVLFVFFHLGCILCTVCRLMSLSVFTSSV